MLSQYNPILMSFFNQTIKYVQGEVQERREEGATECREQGSTVVLYFSAV